MTKLARGAYFAWLRIVRRNVNNALTCCFLAQRTQNRTDSFIH